ncbi:MAG: GDP-mannose 4,6-dehydratase [Gemmatimonadaceae bacterium]|nr:GDP-mannose 4,6-dehydratase [Gemmatimonadaceae bacterium]
MRALITGAAGFVGQWLTRALREAGMEVTGLALADDVTSRVIADTKQTDDHSAARSSLTWRTGDLRDNRFVQEAVNEACPDVVVHLAAISHLPTAAADPAMAWDINVTATARLLAHLDRLRATGAADPVILLVGSAEQYGRQEGSARALPEDTLQAPRTVYAATKAAQEVMALQCWRASGLRVMIARSFNHSGRGQDPRFLLPALAARALALRDVAPGTPLVVGNTTPIRDFLHVSDVVSAYISLLKRGTPGEAYNVASGTGRSVQDIVERVLERAGVQAPLAVDPALVRPVDVPALIGDPRKLQQATGWRAQRTFDDIIDELIHAATH